MDAFANQSTIMSVKFGSRCTFVGKNAFKECVSLSEINDDNVIETIDSGAFAKTNISSLNFNRLIELYSGAFSNCNNLNLVNIPLCSSIPTETFANCINLFSINIPRVGKIGSRAFKDCTNLTTVNIDISPFCEIENNAFYKCNSLKNINFNNITSIGTRAFEDCKSLDNVKLKICKSIGHSAFKGCENITQVMLSNCNVIYENAFADCDNLSKVYIYNSSCRLNGEYVFCTHETPSICKINSNITFYFKPDSIEWYKADQYWSHYLDHMMPMVEENQVIYTTNNNSPIDIDEKFADQIVSNTYHEAANCGVIEFKNTLTSLSQIFKGQTTITSVDISPACEQIESNAFEGCTSLDSISVSDSLKYIGEYAFKNCKALKSFTIPDSLENLGDGSFIGCDNIVEFKGNKNFVKYNGKALVSNGALICVLPKDDTATKGRVRNISNIDENINRLAKSCLYGCENTMRIDMPSGLTSIDNNVFENFTNLIEVHFSGNNPPELGNDVFKNVRSDFKIFVPESGLLEYNNKWKEFENIYPKAEDNCIIYYNDSDAQISLGVPFGVTQTTINNDCINGKYHKISNVGTTLPISFFRNQTSIKKIILPESIKTLGEGAFEGCEKLEYIYLSDNILHIDSGCFVKCKSLYRIHIPNSPNITFGNIIFSLCENLKEFGTYYDGYVSDDNRCYITNSSTLKFFAQGGVTGEYTIPDKITKIAEVAFQFSNITKITLSQYTTAIGDYAFSQCEKLESINNWNNVEIISPYSFYKCESIGKISLPTKLKTISEYAFSGCNKMYINNNSLKNVTSIGHYAFSGCEIFKCVDDSTGEESPLNFDNITQINTGTFQNCSHLTKVSINDKITEIRSCAFENCTNLVSVSISTESKLNTIDSSAFKGCEKLTNLQFPKNLTTIGDSAFEDCKAFLGNSQLPQGAPAEYGLILPENVTSIGSSCFKNSKIAILTITNGLKIIPDSAFSGCELFFFNISNANDLIEIGTKAFYNCKTLGIAPSGILSLPKNLQTIGDRAFEGCTAIKKISLPSKLRQLGNFCLATNMADTVITINKELSTPPVFTSSGKESTTSLPLGNIFATPNNIPALSIYYTLMNKYMYDVYWDVYGRRMTSFSDDNDDDDTNTPETPSTPETPTNQTMGIGFYNTNYVPSNITCEVTSTAGFVGVINSSTPVSGGTPAFGIQSEGTSIVFTITLTATGDSYRSAEVTFDNLIGMSASTSSLTIHANKTSTINTWTGQGAIAVSRSSTTVSAGGKITIKIN